MNSHNTKDPQNGKRRVHPSELAAAYLRGENMIQILRDAGTDGVDLENAIELAYDLQAGTYADQMETNLRFRKRRKEAAKGVARIIHSSMGAPATLLDAGVGEGTTLGPLLGELGPAVAAHAFDLSWSRVDSCRRWLKKAINRPVALSVASFFSIPYADNSFDAVYTFHAIEPNGGREAEILCELYRVTAGNLYLFEPDRKFCSQEGRERMDAHDYCNDLAGCARELGFEVSEHKKFDALDNPRNQTAVTVIRKSLEVRGEPVLICPRFRDPLQKLEGESFYYSERSRFAYPILGGIPCLREDTGIFASKLQCEGKRPASS